MSTKGESAAIARSEAPLTRAKLADALRALGLKAGERVLVHTSMSALGWASGGPATVIWALMDVVTERGTLIMPAFSADLSDPSKWGDPPVPESWWPEIRASLPAFDPLRTPSRGVGRVAELFRSWPGVIRGPHPQASFAAWGRGAKTIVHPHPLEDTFGEHSPLARLYDRQARVLLLGCGFDSCTAFHLGEHRAAMCPALSDGAPVLQRGRRQWMTYDGLDYSSHDFDDCGTAFAAGKGVQTGSAGAGTARLFHLPAAVDFAERWLRDNRVI